VISPHGKEGEVQVEFGLSTFRELILLARSFPFGRHAVHRKRSLPVGAQYFERTAMYRIVTRDEILPTRTPHVLALFDFAARRYEV
jgi:hypothetical protein